jgi:hypothetical protein
MNLFYGVLFGSLTALLFGIEILFFRRSSLPKWADNYVFTSLAVTMVVALGATSLILLTFTVNDLATVHMTNILSSLAPAAVAALVLWRMRIPSRIKRYADESSNVIALRTDETPPAPTKGSDHREGRLAA